MRVVGRSSSSIAICAAMMACASGAAPGAATVDVGSTSPPIADAARDSIGTGMIPAGYGSLKQDDISVRLQIGGLLVRATPLEESVIRVLAPDSYRSLRDRRDSEKQSERASG